MNFIYQKGLISKNNNSVSKIMNRYVYALIPFLILTTIYNIYITKNYNILLNIIITNIICIFIQYIINLIKKDTKFINIFSKNHILILSILLSILTINLEIIPIIILSVITTIFKNIFNLNNKAILISIILINLYKIYYLHIDLPLNTIANIPTYDDINKYASIKDYLLGLNIYYITPILPIITFIYLFHKKSIKYIIPVNIILIYTITVTLIGVLHGLSLWYPLFNIITGNIVFLSIFIATDYINTPLTYEGQVIYGIIIALFLGVLRFITPELAISISILLGTVLTPLIDRISFRLKYNPKFYSFIITLLIIFIIIEIILLKILIK